MPDGDRIRHKDAPRRMKVPDLQIPADWSDKASLAWAQLERIAYRYGALILLIVAVFYYGQYYRSGLNLSGEGGTNAVVAMRLLEGQRPIVDTFLGYNVLWFYSVAGLFQLTGPSYIALRLFYFAMCAATSILAFFIVRRVTNRGFYALIAALIPLLIPGMLFRNYMAFFAMLNMWCLLQAYVFEQRSRWIQLLWMGLGGFALGLTFLTRIDLGTFFTVITLGLLVLYPIRGKGTRRLLTALGGLVLVVVMFVVTHLPFYQDAVHRGYAEPFVRQYDGWIGMVRHLAQQQLEKLQPAPVAPPPAALPEAPSATVSAPAETPSAEPAPAHSSDIQSSSYLQKHNLQHFKEAPSFYDRAFVVILYLPIPLSLLIVPIASIGLLIALIKKNFRLRRVSLVALVTTGSALTLFPQYFFFRPDTPHLSEFMAPFVIALACTIWFAWHWAAQNAATRIVATLLIALAVTDIGLYFYHSYPKESAGTIAAKRRRNKELKAENGVNVWLREKDRDELQQLCDLIRTRTKPEDYVVCYPYAPTINFMTNRRSFEYNLYVDNAYDTSRFFEDTVEEVGRFKPAAILIDNRAINQTEDSRFSNWAAETYQWIRENYKYAGTFYRQEVYLRPDL